MKNTLQINIGTATVDGQTLTIQEIASALRRHGLVLTASRIVTGQWEGKEETTLAVECLPALPICHAECRLAIVSAIGKLARELRQTCIAIAWPDSTGELVPDVGAFDPLFFHPADRVTYAEAAGVPACDCLANVMDACLHNSLVSRDNGDRTGCDKYWRLGQDLQSNADNLRAVICPTPSRNPEITSGW